MFDKKKLNFWRLAVIFLGFTGITLLSLWISPQIQKAAMMNESMATMAKMHLNDITIYDLVNGSDTEAQSSQSGSSQHHEAMPEGTKIMGEVTTIIIFSLLPLLIFGIIILAIVWIK